MDKDNILSKDPNQQNRRRKSSVPKLTMWTLNTTTIHFAVLCRDKQKIANLISGGDIDINSVDKWGRTAIFYSVFGDCLDVKIVQLLLKADAKINCMDFQKKSVFHYAVEKGCSEIISILLQSLDKVKGLKYPEEFAHDMFGMTPLHYASRLRTSYCQNLILKSSVPKLLGDVNAVDNQQRTPLHWAASYGSQECLSKLLEQEANCFITDANKQLPLHYACLSSEKTSVQCLALLLDACPSFLNIQDNSGQGPLHLAAFSQNLENVKKLLSFKKHLIDVNLHDNFGQTALHIACARGDLSIVNALLEFGADVNEQDVNGATAIHFAAVNHHSEITQQLLKAPLHKELSTNENQTALHWAASVGSNASLLLLAQHKSSLTKRDGQGRTALHLAAQCNHSTTVKIILDLEVPINCTDENGASPLHYAIQAGHVKIVKLLLTLGAHLNKRDIAGKTAVHYSVFGGFLSLTHTIVKAGISVNSQDYLKRTPLHHASYLGFTDVICLLLRINAFIDAKDSQGKTPLHYACQENHLEATKSLVNNGALLNCMDATDLRSTPIDCVDALSSTGSLIVGFLRSAGAVSSEWIQTNGAICIQSWWRSCLVKMNANEGNEIDHPRELPYETSAKLDLPTDSAEFTFPHTMEGMKEYFMENLFINKSTASKAATAVTEHYSDSEDEWNTFDEIDCSKFPAVPSKLVTNSAGGVESRIYILEDKFVCVPERQEDRDNTERAWNEILSNWVVTKNDH